MADESQQSPVRIKLSPDVPVTDDLRAFLRAEGLDAEDGAIRIAASDDRRECSADTLWHGGRIDCELARSLAGKLGISVRKMGELLELLNVKIMHCGLGCF